MLAVSHACQADGYTWEVEVTAQPEQAALSVGAVFSILMLHGDRITDCTLTIRNTTEAPVTIIWDESVFVLQDETSERLSHADMQYTEQAEVQSPGLIPPQTAIQGAVWPANLSDKPVWIDDGDRIQLFLTWVWQEDLEKRNEMWEWTFGQQLDPEALGEPEEPPATNWWLVGGGLLALSALAIVLLTGVIPPLW